MISAPVFIFWDESVPSAVSNQIKSSFDRIFSGAGSKHLFNVFLSVECFTAEGHHTTVSSLKKFETNILGKFGSDKPGNAISLTRLEIDKYVNGRFDAQQRSEMSRPFVIIVTSRPWATEFDSQRMVRDLFDSTTGPRLAVFDQSGQFNWTQEIKDKDEKKRVRVYPLTENDIDLEKYLRDFEEWFFTKISEAPSAAGVVNPMASVPVQPVADSTVQRIPPTPTSPPAQEDRPTISINNGAPTLTPPPPPAPAGHERPAVVVNGAEERPVIAKDESPQPSQKNSGNAPSVDKPVQPQETEIDIPALSTSDKSTEKPKRKTEKEDDSQGWLRSILGRGGKTKTPPPDSIVEPVPGSNDDSPVIDEPTSPVSDIETGSPVVEAPTHAADGQIIIDKKSSLNAKPWYFPEWKSLPSAGPSRDLEIEYGSVGELRVFAGSTRGTKHQYYGDENQDAFFVARTADPEKKESRFVVLVASDGVGSATYSAFGSKSLSFLVGRKTAVLLEDFEESSCEVHDLIRSAIKEASDATQSWSTNELYAPKVPPGEASRNDVSATLSVAVIDTTKSESGMRKVWLACVGDSPCYSLKQGDWTLRSAVTKDGEVLEHGTQALPILIGQEPVLETFTFELHESELLMLVSDGIGTSMASGNTVVGRWMAQRLFASTRDELLQHLSPSELISTLTFDRQGEDDDRTMILLFDFDGFTNSIPTVNDEATSRDTQIELPEVP
jgi:serine/threonine protein phosphatase PrpC